MSDLIEVEFAPAKRFFVDMLIRDIELTDALLDLLDNCVDGAMRTGPFDAAPVSRPYQGRYAHIRLSADRFEIQDNCGGIAMARAEHYAFRMGNTSLSSADFATVGVYGIGMKRAIFKLGKHAFVQSRSPDSNFTVEITPQWMQDDKAWTIPMTVGNSTLDIDGTKITVSDLRDQNSKLFSDESTFLEDLVKAVSTYYGYIIEKGFEVTVNGVPVQPRRISLLLDRKSFSEETQNGISPYVYKANHDGVEVGLAIGFYRGLPSEEEEDEALEGPTVETAGITIICNDRVVVYADKTRITGWGEERVPQYHTQFVSIAGILRFHSTDASKLPLTTTKRGIDGNSHLYLAVKDQLREGLKYFTDFTNRWKGFGYERVEIQQSAETISPERIAESIPAARWTNVSRGLGGQKFRPHLPVPKEVDPPKQIRFTQKTSEIETVANFLFEDHNISAAQVGQRCFIDVLAKATK